MKRYFYVLFFNLLLIIIFNVENTVEADLTPQEYTGDPPLTSYTHIEFDEIAPFNRDSFELDAQPQEWQNQMIALGQQLENARVRYVYFVHGTFAGNDPVGIVECIKCVYPKLSTEEEENLLDLAERNVNELLSDVGNFLPEYVELFEKAIGNNISCSPFPWSSKNDHLARLRGSVELAKKLYDDITSEEIQSGDRILLIGHSHAGQLFALLTNFLAQSTGVKELLDIAGEKTQDFNKILQEIRKVRLDIVTFGTPPRYGWGEGDYRLLNIINHRGEGYLSGGFFGLLNTKDGDYVQQWGIAGTDIIAVGSIELNKRLDSILGEGRNRNAWLRNIQARMRVPHYGNKTFLVDYKDSSSFIFLPNCITTLFGHGVYTKFEKMLFNTNLIVNEFYR